jgi:hypothetical protein
MKIGYNVYRALEGTAADSYELDLTEEEYEDFLNKKEEITEEELLEYLNDKYPDRAIYVDTEYDDQGGEIQSVEFI